VHDDEHLEKNAYSVRDDKHLEEKKTIKMTKPAYNEYNNNNNNNNNTANAVVKVG